jgi:multiple sugar transport system substrate-binding protein
MGPRTIGGRRGRLRPARGLALLLGALVLLGGCGERARGDRPITLVFKHAKILGPADPLPGLVREFEARHPGIRVETESLPWNSDEQHQFYVINLEGGGAPLDVMMLDVIWVAEFARAGWLLDLTPHVEPGERERHFPSAIAAAAHGGRLWALPWIMNVGLLYYRADLLAKHGLAPPETWEDLVAQVGRIREGERGPRLDGVLWQGKQYEGMVVNVLEAVWANGARVMGEEGEIFPDRARAEEALAFLRRLITSGVSPAWVTAADEELTRRAFGAGRAIFLRNWPYARDLFELPDSPVRGKVGMAPLPRHAGGTRGAGSTGGAHLAVDARTRHPAAAVALARFLTGAHAQRAMAAGVALNPTRLALYDDPDLVRSHPHLPAVRSLALQGRPRPVTPHYLTISTTLQPEFSAALVGVKSPAGALAHAELRLRHLLRAVGDPAP